MDTDCGRQGGVSGELDGRRDRGMAAGEAADADRTRALMGKLLLTRLETAELLGVTCESIDYYHRMRRLRGVQIGKRLMWRPPDVEAFVAGLDPDAR